MQFMRTVLGSASLLALGLAAPAWADVSPDDVWADLTRQLSRYGYTFGATETRSGDTLTLSDLTMVSRQDDSGAEMTLRMGDLVLEGQGDGTVHMLFADTLPLSMTVVVEGEKPMDLGFDLKQRGLMATVSGAPEDIRYEYAADSLTLLLTKLSVPDEPVSEEHVSFRAEIGPMTSSSHSKLESGNWQYEQSSDLGDLNYDLSADAPEGVENGGSMSVSGQIRGIRSEGTAVLPENVAPGDVLALMQAGFKAYGKVEQTGGSQMQFTAKEMETPPVSGGTRSNGAVLTVRMSGEEVSYDVAVEGMSFEMQGGQLPFPVSGGMEETRLNLKLPVAKSDTPRDAALGITLGGFTMADPIWSLFDPAKILPRDPATVSFDLTGKVTPFVTLFDPSDMALLDGGEALPGELNALTLKSLNVDVAGAKITGEGDFTFDNTDLQSFEGMPKPTGALSLNITGANGLIDKLIQMGFVTDQDAMGARMMMSMFGVPGAEPDSLSSKIEVTEQGHVLANGQRIK